MRIVVSNVQFRFIPGGKMIDYSDLFEIALSEPKLKWILELHPKIKSAFNHGDFEKWEKLLISLPKLKPNKIDFNSDTVIIGSNEEIDNNSKELLYSNLKQLMPWRKGPFNLFGNFIDSEWRSNLKWDRLKNAISPLDGKSVLDIGSGNGYYGWRMLGQNAETVIGIDPYLLSVIQFFVFKNYIPGKPFWVLPFGIETLPNNISSFDTVFSMGIFYHRRSPFDHLIKLKTFLREGGELVLETLIIDGKDGEVLVPHDRYAKMRNVWFIPSAITIESWLKRSGYTNIRLIDITKTTETEQRKTEWMDYESLDSFLNKKNHDLTIEGYPAPKRAIFIANSP